MLNNCSYLSPFNYLCHYNLKKNVYVTILKLQTKIHSQMYWMCVLETLFPNSQCTLRNVFLHLGVQRLVTEAVPLKGTSLYLIYH